MRLNDTVIRSTKPRQKLFKLSDSGGLHLLVQPNGTKLWRQAYRINGKQRTLAFGVYPTVSLADARAKRDAAKKLLEEGRDPAVQRKIDKQARGNSFRLVGDELLDKMRREGRAPATLTKTEWLLEFSYDVFGDRPVAKITAPELLAVLRKIEARGTYETARRLRSTCGMVFRYAIATGRAERDPSVDLRGALTTPTVKHRATIIEPAAIGALLRAIDDFDGQPTTKAALCLAALVFARPGEIRHAEWKEFDFDKAEWIIPAEKMKMRRPHRVPLSRQTLAILKDLKTITGEIRWLFPSVRTVMRPISENTLNSALRRMGYVSDAMSAHGFRAMAATGLPVSWNSITVGQAVLGQADSAADGWWPANVVDIDGEMLILQARDFPKAPKVIRHRSAVALFFTKDFVAPEQSDDVAPGLPINWAKLEAGHLVIAQDAKAENGWWEAEIVKIATEKLTLRWKDSPRQPTVTRMRTAVALLNPIPPKQS